MRDQAQQGVRLGASLASALVALLFFASQAVAVTISADPEENLFAGNPFSQAAGTQSQFSNPGSPNVTPHNVYADRNGSDGGPLFLTSRVVAPGSIAQVRGTEYLPRGSYRFNCTLHSGMDGVLEVTSGTPVPRPRVAPTIRSRSLDTVRRKGKVEIGVSAKKATGPVRVTVKVKGKVVATAKSGSLAAGKVRKLSARLTGKGRKTIAKGSSVRFQLTGVAEFGTPKAVSKVLRSGR